MAAVKSQESPSSSLSSSPCRYQVFLSFRGADTRKNFISHLYAALVRAGIHTFRDDDEIRRGENIESELKTAIQQSKIAIVVFSEDYASSRWCLDELVMIMEQRRTTGCKVWPIFYHVDPSDVSEQTGSFGRAFVKHEKRPHEEIERVNGWRVVLKEVADLGGLPLGEEDEAEFVKSIVEKVLHELKPVKVHVPLFTGRDDLLDCINSWLKRGSNDCEIAMLYGIGGVGKTTIAKVVYKQNLDTFESISFLGNIGQRSKQSDGLLSLQRQLLHDVLNKNTSQIHDVDEGIMKIKDAICHRRVLLILDDVDTKDQFNAIVGMREWLYLGSKIIVTTRNKGLFAIHEQILMLKIEPLDEKDSIELFSWHAFRQSHPIEEFVELSKTMVRHCDGLPLALVAIGSSLSSTRIKEEWESKLQEMEKIPDSKIQKVLRISYDSLDDDYQKDLFLDVACFFIEMDVDCLVQILNGFGTIGGKWRIGNLINRCLVEIDNSSNRLCMHQIIRDMGREIASEQSPKCRRIWDNDEAFTMLKEIADTEMVHGLTLDMHALMEDSGRKDHNFLKGHNLSGFFSSRWLSSFLSEKQVQIGQTSLFPILNTAAFKKMQKIKFLQLNYVRFNGSYEQFPKSLIWLRWHGFYLRSIPKHCSLEKLVVLDMQSSTLVYVWEGKMHFPRLKILDLSRSHSLITTPDFSHAPNLESLILEDCINLVEIHQSIGELHGLRNLNLKGCKSLKELPEQISKLDSLENLNLDGCSNLDRMNTKSEQEPQRRWSLHRDGIVSILPRMTAMPLKIFFQFWLSRRKTNRRFSTLSLPRLLFSLNLSGTPIRCLPESIKDLTRLDWLYLTKCTMLQKVPELPTNLKGLVLNDCPSLDEVANIMFCEWTLLKDSALPQEWVKQDLIQRVDIRVFMIIGRLMRQIQLVPWTLEIVVENNLLSVYLHDAPGSNVLSSFRDKGWLPTHDLPGKTFKLSIPDKLYNKFWGFIFYTRLSVTQPIRRDGNLCVRFTNNTKGQSKGCRLVLPLAWAFYKLDLQETIWTSCWIGDDDLVFEDGDEVSVWMYSPDPAIQIQTVALENLYVNEVFFTELGKAEIASFIFRHFTCSFRGVPVLDNSNTLLYYSFIRKGMNN